MQSLIEEIQRITEEAKSLSDAEGRIENKSHILAKHVIMVHHVPEDHQTVLHWAGEINGHLVDVAKNAAILNNHKRLQRALFSCDIGSERTYSYMLKKISEEKSGIKFDKPSQEGHEKVLETLNRFASELSAGKLPKMFPDNS